MVFQGLKDTDGLEVCKAIEIDNQNSEAYLNRGIVYITIGMKNEGCIDLSKAGELGNITAYDSIKELCN